MFEKELPIVGQFGAEDITRGVCRYLCTLGYSPLTEFKLTSNRRVDVMGLNSKGFYIVIEVKSSVADFRHPSDQRASDTLLGYTKVEACWMARRINPDAVRSPPAP